MKHRSPFAVFMLSIITFGIYDIYWLVVTKKELNQKTSIHTPTIWLLFAPFIALIAIAVLVLMNASNMTSTTANSTVTAGANIAILILDFVAFLVILPITFFWFFKFSKAVNEYTSGKMSTGITFLLLWLLHLFGVAIVQDTFNDMLATDTNTGGLVPPAEPASPQPWSAPPQSPVEPATPPTTVPESSVSVSPVSPAPEDPQPPQAPPAGPIVSG